MKSWVGSYHLGATSQGDKCSPEEHSSGMTGCTEKTGLDFGEFEAPDTIFRGEPRRNHNRKPISKKAWWMDGLRMNRCKVASNEVLIKRGFFGKAIHNQGFHNPEPGMNRVLSGANTKNGSNLGNLS